jgi:cytochrome c peroxidase
VIIKATLLLSALLLSAQDGLSPERLARKLRRMSPRAELAADPTNRVADNMEAALLGKALFFDPRLSSDGRFSCATCHDPERAFTDGRALPDGRGEIGRNSPTLLNVGRRRWLFWDGRADSLWAQFRHPLENPVEMDGDRLALAHLITTDTALKRRYTEVFGATPDLSDDDRFPARARPGATNAEDERAIAWREMRAQDQSTINTLLANTGKALAAYQRKLETAESPFDRYVRAYLSGDETGGGHISPKARRGVEVFLGKGKCTLCHMGSELTDEEFHHLAVPSLNNELPIDIGRYLGAKLVKSEPFNAASVHSDQREGEAADFVSLLKADADQFGELRTPSLRNVAETAPYMHQGQFTSLEEVVHFYSTLEGAQRTGHHQELTLTPANFTEAEEGELLAFLRSLSAPLVEPQWGESPTTQSPTTQSPTGQNGTQR